MIDVHCEFVQKQMKLTETRAKVGQAFLSESEFDAAIYPMIGMFQNADIRATASISYKQVHICLVLSILA